MSQLAKKNGSAPLGEGTASEIRAAARSAAAAGPGSPEKPKRRTFTAEYKRRILREADAASSSGEGAVGELLRREGLYSSHLTTWRRERDAGELAGLTPKTRGRKATRNPLADEVARLQRENERLQVALRKAETIIDVQKKVADLLGETLPTPTEEDFQRRKKP